MGFSKQSSAENRSSNVSENICKPNFFVVGAPKSGTTSLHDYLSQHPDVFMSKYKEPCFLAPDFLSPSYVQSEEEYLRCFQGWQGERRVGESTTSYMYSKMAATKIGEYAPGAKIIVMLRNPVDMIASLHAQYVKTGNENILCFEDALEAEAERAKGKRIPAHFCYPNEYLLYRQVGKYAEQLHRYLSVFGRENVHVIIFDDFQQNSEKEFGSVCRFLGVSLNSEIDFAKHNSARSPRSKMLHYMFLQLKSVESKIVKILKPIIPLQLRSLLRNRYHSLWDLNMKAGRDSVSIETRAVLSRFYRNDIKILEGLLGRDFGGWIADCKK